LNKKNIHDLALFGGTPLFNDKLHVGAPHFESLEPFYERLRLMFENNWVTNNGPLVQEFERRIAELLQVKHCIAVCNGTLALSLACRAMGLSGEVIVPSFTFIATAHALQWQGIKPVFCDVVPGTCLINPVHAESLITDRTTGIIGVHTFGNVCDIDELQSVAARNGVHVLFDAAHAFGTTYNQHYVGSFGDAEVFSFHATKVIHAFEGGAITTNDDELAEKLRLMRNFGFEGYDNVVYAGINGKMTEVCAAMGLTSLEGMSQIFEVNKRNYEVYSRAFSELQIDSLKLNGQEKNNYQYIACLWDDKRFGVNRDQILSLLHAENILARRYFYPGCHRMPFYAESGDSPLLTETDQLSERILLLPTGSAVSVEEINKITDLLSFIVNHSNKIVSLL
jgi:dTDP-4-amino-4,6-dideoxygalactose transaminase